MKEFNIGDKVIITDAGRNYRSYDEWVEKNAPTYLAKWESRPSIKIPEDILFHKDVGKIVAKHSHSESSEMLLYLIDFGDVVYLLDGLGIKLNNQNYYYTIQGKQHFVIVE